MSYTSLDANLLTTGNAVRQEVMQLIKSNEDDLNSRLNQVEGAVNAVQPISFHIGNKLSYYKVPKTGYMYEPITVDMTLLSARILQITAGFSGTTSVDIQYKRGANPYTSIFSTLPSVSYTAGDNYLSSNAVLSTTSLLIGDILRFDWLTKQGSPAETFVCFLEWESA